jgi:hypothetical protein
VEQVIEPKDVVGIKINPSGAPLAAPLRTRAEVISGLQSMGVSARVLYTTGLVTSWTSAAINC